MKSYSDKLKSPKWQKRRLEILDLRGFKCEVCGCEEKELHVHHRFYLKGREVWQYDNDVFQVLCCDCHEKEHKKEKKDIEFIPNNLKILTPTIKNLSDYEADNLLFFLQEVKIDFDLPEVLGLLSDAVNSGWFEKSLEYIRDQKKIEELEIGLTLIKDKFELLKKSIEINNNSSNSMKGM